MAEKTKQEYNLTKTALYGQVRTGTVYTLYYTDVNGVARTATSHNRGNLLKFAENDYKPVLRWNNQVIPGVKLEA